MMPPPPARRNAGTAYLHITKAPVRLTAMALFQSSSESVSTVPSGVTVAATLTNVVSRPNFATVRSTAPFALASSATSTWSACARPPLAVMAGIQTLAPTALKQAEKGSAAAEHEDAANPLRKEHDQPVREGGKRRGR